MFRVMIVDDEHIIRKGLINFINWSDLDCEVVCESDNGLEAKDYLHSRAPDIVIADIKMPGLNGIKLAEYIYKNCPSIKIILLTGYSDFEYARSAIKYNVVDFVLKPSSTEGIIEAVNKAKKIILKDQTKENKLLHLENRIKENLQEMQEKFLQDLMNGIFFNKSNVLNKLHQLKISVNNFYVVVYEFDSSNFTGSSSLAGKKQNILVEIKNFISTIFKDYKHYTLITGSRSLCTLISFRDNDRHKSMKNILEKSEEILRFVINFIDIPTSIGISDMHTNPSEIQCAFDEANKCLSHKFYDDDNIFIYSDYMVSQHHLRQSLTDNYIDNIVKHLEVGDNSQALEELHGLYEYQKNSKQSIDHIKTSSALLCSLCSKLLNNYNSNFSDLINDSDTIYEDILKCESIVKLFEILEKVIQAIPSSLSLLTHQDNYIIKKAMGYIKENYQNTVKLDDIADFVHVNSCYLSRLFRKETGSTLTETITKVRIERAKKLLLSENSKTYEIALMVGFDDPAYFSQVFKKYTGSSPNQYRKQNL